MTAPFRPVLLLACTLPAVAVTAQSVLLVGPGGYETIQAAVDAATDGDVVRIAPGTYTPFQTTKGLSIVADQPGTVTVRPLVSPTQTSIAMTAGQQTRLCDLVFANNLPVGSSGVGISGGFSSIEGCTFESFGASQPGLFLSSYAVVAMRHCTLTGGTTTARLIYGAHLSASECTFVSGPMSLTSFDAALLMQDSTAHLSNCLVVGGSVAPLVYAIQAGIGIRYYNGAVWLVDCDVRGGDSNNGFSPGGHAVRAGGVPLRHHRCTLTAGTGPGGAVAVIDGPAQAGPLLGVTTTPEVLQLGSTFTIHFAAEPADPVFTLATTHVVYTGPSALLEQHALGFFGSGGVTLGFGLADASGHLQVQVAVPTTASLLHLGVWFRGIATASLPLQASPVVGGVIR